jgi:predicted kinase
VADFRARCEELGILGREPQPLLSEGSWAALGPPDPHLRRRVAGEGRFRRLKGVLNAPQEMEDWLRAQEPAPAGTLYVPVGVPGSGKSTWVQANLQHAALISMDEMREQWLGTRADQSRNQEIYRRARAALGRALRGGETVVWDAQSHTWSARQGLLGLARDAHAYVVIICFDVPLAVALERNRGRDLAVPEDVIRHSYRDLEEPRPFEAEEIWRVDVRGRCTRCIWRETVGP